MKMVEADGWQMVKQRCRHRQYEDPAKQGWVTIVVHPSVHAALTEHQG
jgi:predicted RNA binding protein YcfA (HicA-like mRNA interferase family)